jgi:hypothetical protein
MLDRLSRWVPLTGVLSAVLGVAGSMIEIAVNPLDINSSGAQVIAFYRNNFAAQLAATILLGFGFIFLVFFAGSLRAYLRRTPALEALSALIPIGAAVLLVGQFGGLGIGITLLDPSTNRLDPVTARTLNVLSGATGITSGAGLFVFGICSGLAILRGARLPNWLGWLAIAIAVVVMTPAEGFAFIALAVWVVVTSLLIFVRSGAPTLGAAPAAESTLEQQPR